MSENWFVDSTVRPLTSRSFYVDFNYGLQFVDEDGTLITGDIGDIEVDDETVCTVEEMGRLDNCFLIVGNAAGSATITISAGGTVYQDTITVEDLPDDPSDPGSGDDPSGHGSNDSACHLETFTLDGKDYAVGFGFERDGGMLDLYGSGHSGPSSEYELMSGGSYGEGEWDQFDYGLFVARISGTEGGNTIYSDVTNQMDFEITKIWLDLDTATGDRDTFSLARGSQQVTALTEDIANPPLIYYDKSHAGSVQVHANVLAEGTSYEVWFTVTCLEKVTQTIDLSSAASIHEINQILEAYEKSRDSVFIQLGAKEYGGPGDDPAIIIPDLSDDWSPSAITVLGEKGENGSTVINGGIVLESSAAGFISEVTLKARTEGEGTGITSVSGTGPYNLYACGFYDFDTAVDSTNSFIGATQDNYFEHNAVALKIALKDEGCNQDQLEGNSFFENGTAVLVTSLNDFITPYYFRLRDGQFIGNGTDFDISQEGEYYFYRNQFAADGATLRRPVIAEHPDVILHCYPARDLSGDLVLDQDDNTILNDQAGELQIKVSQLGGHKLTIVTDDGTGSRIAGYIDALLASAGTTSLPSGLRSAASSAEGEATFTPSLDVTRETDAVTAVLAEVPQGLTLRVSIPDIEWEEVTVTHNGEELEGVTVENGTVTFPAEDGGSYVIAAKTEEAETPEDPDTPSEPDTPPTPSRPSGGSTPAEEPEEPAPEEPGEPSEEELAEAAAEKFDDVEADDWFAEAVGYAVEKGFVAGTGEKTFSPDMLLTRGMLVQMLYGIAGTPDAGAGTDFSDVEDSDWYAEAVAWASENGIAAGYGEAFGPEDPVTREQMVTMLLAYAKFMGYEIVEGADLSAYADEDAISTWAENAMAWAKAADLVSGRSETMLVPSGNATRAETVVILMNFLRFVAE
ncbi:MAG: S-layer homology domain-containing protein [Firmicutes bacterium]|nr:S-layer homology domain-containing protein [Bacillota bacterium]